MLNNLCYLFNLKNTMIWSKYLSNNNQNNKNNKNSKKSKWRIPVSWQYNENVGLPQRLY